MSEENTPRAANSFREAQALSSRRLGFSVTKACPLRCGHCSVSAAPNLKHTTFTREFGESVAAQMPALSELGIRFIDFTGGEPTLAADFVRIVSAAAKAHGISTGIVTAAHWAIKEQQAVRFVERFRDVDNWDISTDVYHLPFVDLEQVELAFKVLSESGRPPLIRIAHHEPLTLDDAVVIDTVYKFAGRHIAFQPVGPVGRGAELFEYLPAAEADADHSPCPSTGPLVQPGGQVAPCCAPLSHEDYDHPLRLGNAFTEPLADIVTRWRVHPLLQTIRLWGFGPVVHWLREAGADYRPVLRHRVCHECVELVRDKSLLALAAERANTLPHRVKVAFGLKEAFGEEWMDDLLRREAEAMLEGAAA